MANLKNTSDTELTYLINAGVKEAFQEIFERYAGRIYQFSLSYLKNEQDAEELVQDVFLKIWEKRESLDKSKNIKAFIFKVAVNSIYDFIRRKNVENAFRDFSRANFEKQSDNTWHQVIFDEMSDNLETLIKQMPPERQRVFRLSREEGLSNEEIASKLNISKRTAENQLYRATTFLKKHFKADSLFAMLFLYLWCG
ncbi:RNA polymerase sigma-70 factor, ECF subfamily [Mariniphaga anaerophila]|uniref:RNA polymerase sigma factor n=1 Tax=Mariniphaga anaerophila TaxID=1484053 RepID=A0A1M5BA20_9BACT|nr:RNA polymerase sigma-70 factor [Mariniphaga anaerophila]SHF39363.1 RNA polymerase sigma-70 factor, ECF subfamily [Mariniphaga anaerophila]